MPPVSSAESGLNTDPDLAFIEKRWAGLPERTRQAVLALVRARADRSKLEV